MSGRTCTKPRFLPHLSFMPLTECSTTPKASPTASAVLSVFRAASPLAAALSEEEKELHCRRAEEKFLAAGATAVLRNLSELPAYLEKLEAE